MQHLHGKDRTKIEFNTYDILHGCNSEDSSPPLECIMGMTKREGRAKKKKKKEREENILIQ